MLANKNRREVFLIENKNLIVYYSHSGNTEEVAQMIHKAVGGNIVRIKPTDPYPRDYSSVVKQAKKEIQSGFLPKLMLHINDINGYDNVFVGSPNWWSTTAPPVTSFLSQFDFTGKTIVPFCTHGGGGAGRVFSDIKKLCPGSDVLKGFLCYGSSAGSESISAWLKQIGL